MKKVKFVTLAATALLAAGILTACGNNNNDTATTSEPATTETTEADVTTAATETDATDVATLKHGLSADGTWIVHSTKSIDASGETITVEGNEFMHRGEKVENKRKLAFYTQERDNSTTPATVTITDSFTLTVERLIIKSNGFDLSNMTVKGDVYVDADDFTISTTEGTEFPPAIDGNLYFATEAQMDAFKAADGDLAQFVHGDIAVKTAE
jgi:hypothetical protein